MRPPSKTEQLIADLLAAGGVLRVPYWREEGQPDYRQRAIAAQRFGKVPTDKRLVMERIRGAQLEIRLEDALADAQIELQPVPVPARLTRPHPAAARYRDNTDEHLVSRAMLSRSVRILHALATEAERRGHTVGWPNVPKRERTARSELLADPAEDVVDDRPGGWDVRVVRRPARLEAHLRDLLRRHSAGARRADPRRLEPD